MIRTACPYCGVGCGIRATATGERQVTIVGDPDQPANAGKLCSKGTHLGETVGLEGRLLHPMIGKNRASWDRALDLVAKRFRDTIARHGPDSVAFYVSGQLLTEDYYVANKLMKGFIGSANIDTNSRLCMASAVAGHKARGSRRVAVMHDGRLAAVLMVTRSGELPPRDYLLAMLGETPSAPSVLAGRAPGAAVDRGAIVCACFDVGLQTIVAAIAERQLADVAAIGAALGAGTNCGSCRPALARLLVVAGAKVPVGQIVGG